MTAGALVDQVSVEPPPARLPRVLLVTEAAGGGVGRHFLDLAQGLAAQGAHVQGVYATGRMDALFRERLEAGGLPPMHRLQMRRSISPRDWLAAWNLARLARRLGGFDVIHGHSSKGGAIARLAARWLGIPCVYTPHALVTLDPTLAPWKRSLYSRMERWLAHSTAAIIAVSGDEAAHAKQLGIDPAKVHVVPNGIASPRLLAREDARRRMGIPDSSVVIGFVGRLSPQKAPDHLLRGFAALADRQPAACVAMIGSGPLEPELRRLADELGIAGRVYFLGDVVAQPLMSGFDLFCLPSRYEGMPYVLLEALAAGLPIVVTEVGGARLAVTDDDNGCIVPIGESASLTQALERIIADPVLRARFARASSAKATQFTCERMTRQTLDLYCALIRPQSPRP